jgi:GNAT superfamily N-acetyltransferase
VDEWNDGFNRFDRPGELLAEVRCDGVLCAIGGLNVDPYVDDPAVGRIRHVFVHPSHRRSGVGGALIDFLVDHVRAGFRRVRLRSLRDAGPPFYASLGFTTTDEINATHVLDF